MNTWNFYCCLLFSALLLLGCGKSELSPREYVNWFDNPDNGMIKEFEQGTIKMTCQYMAPEYAVLKQSDPTILVEEEVKSNIEAVSDLVQFKLRFESLESSNFLKDNYTTAEEFNTQSMYLSYGIQSDLELITGEDTVMCNMLHHERTYGNTPFETLLISFPKKSTVESDMEVIFEDRVFGLGRVKFFYPLGGGLDKLPVLVL